MSTTRARQFAVSGLLAAVALLGIGWLTGLRQTMHVALLSVATVAFFPFVVIGACLALIVAAVFLSALSGGGDALHAEGPGELAVGAALSIPRYYRWLAGQRHPLFWGVLAGALLGGLLLWGWIAVAVLPGEDRTSQILADSKEQLEHLYSTTGSYPEPVNGHLLIDGAEVDDGFGRPLLYQRSGEWKLQSFTLTSPGYDGAKGTDDLCISGSTRMVEGLQAAVELAKLVSHTKRGHGLPAIPDRLAAIKALHCD